MPKIFWETFNLLIKLNEEKNPLGRLLLKKCHFHKTQQDSNVFNIGTILWVFTKPRCLNWNILFDISNVLGLPEKRC